MKTIEGGSLSSDPLRVFFPGLSSTPETFLQQKLRALERHGVAAVRRKSPIGSLPFPRPHVVHFEWNSGAIAALTRPAIWRRPTIISCRGTQIRVRPYVTGGYAAQLRETFSRATAIHCVCEAIRQEAISLGADEAKTLVIYPGVDVDEVRPTTRGAIDGPLRLLSVGSLIWTKGYEYALLSLQRLLGRGVPALLEIVGAGDDLQRLRFTVRDLELDSFVTIRGQLNPAEVREALGRTDVFIHSSLSEGISNAVLEAMASAVPVVTTDCGGMREAVSDGLEGFLVPVRSPKATAVAIERLARSPELRRRMGVAAREKVVSTFSLAEHVRRFLQLYRSTALRGAARSVEASVETRR